MRKLSKVCVPGKGDGMAQACDPNYLEAEIGRISISGQPGQKINWTLWLALVIPLR
jgi:hypothetical protein